MAGLNYISFLSYAGRGGYNSTFLSTGGAETAGTVARAYSNASNMGGETAGSVASSSFGGSTSSSSCGCSFSAVA